MKFKTILSIISLVSCFCIMLVVSYAWITITRSNKTGDTLFPIENPNCNYELYSYVNNNWVESNENISINDYIPGEIYYFRLDLTSIMSRDITATVYFANIMSSISSELLYDNLNKIVYVTDNENNNLPLYEVNNQKVMYDDKILYNCSNEGVLSLESYKIENAINFYVLPDSNLSLDNAIQKNKNEKIYDRITLQKNSTLSFYFAFEFSDSDDVSCYQYQIFTIESIIIQLA